MGAPVDVSELILQSGQTQVEIHPDLGGTISRYRSDTRRRVYEWMRPFTGDVSLGARAAGCFPLMPFSGRIRDGRFRFEGREVQLPLNFPPERHAIHGHGWQARWRVARHGATRAVLEFLHDADGWPWSYAARQIFELDGEDLSVTIGVENRSTTAMPVGIGLHPYFVRTPNARVQASVREVWETDEEVMPVRLAPALPDYPLEHGFAPASRFVDNAFSGWSGTATIEWPEWDAALRITAQAPLRNLVVYTPPNEDFFCVEPVSNTTDAFNLMEGGQEGHGAIVLPAGESLTAQVRFLPDR